MPPDDTASLVVSSIAEEEFDASFSEDEEEDYYQLMKESYEAEVSLFMEEWTASKRAAKEEASRSWREYTERWEVEKRRLRDEGSLVTQSPEPLSKEWWAEMEEQRKFIDRMYSEDGTERDEQEGQASE